MSNFNRWVFEASITTVKSHYADIFPMILRVTCHLQFQIDDPSALVLMLKPKNSLRQRIASGRYSVSPKVRVSESSDSFGNFCQRLLAPTGEFEIQTQYEVMTNDVLAIAPGAEFVEIQDLPSAILPFLLPSRYCESDRFGDLAREIVADALPGYDQVKLINDWVRTHIIYKPGSSELPLSAIEVNQQGYGVCRDLAQLAIALCRSISIPARLVVGYLHALEPMDLHAWFEAYVGKQWYCFDPTQAEHRGGRVVIAFGRDAADVAIFHQFGLGCQLHHMTVAVERLDRPSVSH